MARLTFCREERFSLCCISDKNIRCLRHRLAATDREAVNISGNIGHLSCSQVKLGHSSPQTVLDDRQNVLSSLIGKNSLRTQQIGAATLTAARVGTMTESAINRVESFSTFYCRRISRRPLRKGAPSETSARRRRLTTRRWRVLSRNETAYDGCKQHTHHDSEANDHK